MVPRELDGCEDLRDGGHVIDEDVTYPSGTPLDKLIFVGVDRGEIARGLRREGFTLATIGAWLGLSPESVRRLSLAAERKADAKKMPKNVRKAHLILALEKRGGEAWARDLADDLGVTVQTVRADLYELAHAGKVDWLSVPAGPARFRDG